jgi:hypothetical protein
MKKNKGKTTWNKNNKELKKERRKHRMWKGKQTKNENIK